MRELSNYEREKAIYRYVTALDNGDLDVVAEILELALYDLELARIIEEIDLAYQEEEGITAIASDAAIVRDLIQQHLHSAFEEPDIETKRPPDVSFSDSEIDRITVGDVARHLQQSEYLSENENELVKNLLNSSITLPVSLSIKAIKQLFSEDLKQNVNKRFLDKFRNIAIELEMKRSHNNALLAAARQQKSNYKSK